MAKSKSWEIWAVGLLIVAVLLYSNGTLKLGTTAGSLGVPSPSNPNIGGTCPSIAQNFLVSVAYPDYTKSPVQQTLVASQTINAYSQTPTPTPTVTATASSSSSAATALTSLNCNGVYLITSGDNSGYFLNSTVQNIGTSVNFPVTIVAPKYSAVTVTVANTLQQTPTTQAYFTSVTGSKTVTGYIVVQAGQYTASEGPMALSFAYNSVSVQSINVGGISLSSAAVPSMTFQTTNALATGVLTIGVQNTQGTVLLPSIANFQYSSGSGSSIGSYEIPVTVQTTSSYASNELISFQVTPGTNFFNPATGTVQVGVYKNPQTNANLFAPVALNGAFVLKNTA